MTEKRKTKNEKRLIPLGIISGAHGIRGQVKIRSFTADPGNITAYGPLQDASGRIYAITVTGGTNDSLIASIEGVATRSEAEALRNTELLIARNALPETGKNEYYHEDLTGLNVVTAEGKAYGTIAAVHNFGAGDILAIRKASGEEELLPFTRIVFPRIDPEKGVAIISPPETVQDD